MGMEPVIKRVVTFCRKLSGARAQTTSRQQILLVMTRATQGRTTVWSKCWAGGGTPWQGREKRQF